MKTKRTLPLLVIALLYSINIYAQQSINNLQNNIKSSTAVDSLNKLAFNVKYFSITKALNILSASENLARQSDYEKGLATAYLYEANIYKECDFDKKALSLFYSSLNISNKLHDTSNIAVASEQIALYLQNQGSYDSSLNMFRQVLFFYEKLNNEEKIIQTKINISTIEIEQENYTEASQLITDALAASRSAGYNIGEATALYNMALLNIKLQNLQKGDSILNSIIKRDCSINDKTIIIKTLLQLSQLALKNNFFIFSARYALNAYHIADSIKNNNLQQQSTAALISICNVTNDQTNLNRWKDSLLLLKDLRYQQLKGYAYNFVDILQNDGKKNKVAEQHNLESGETSKLQLTLLIITVILFITFVIMAIPLYINYKKTKRLTKDLTEKNNLINKNASSLDHLSSAISRQNQKLEEENKMKDKLLSIISHDLRHPLVNTKSILDLINTKLIDPIETEELLSQLEGQYVRSLSLLDNLLFWIRGQMKGIKIERTGVNIYNLFNSLTEEQRFAISSKNLHIKNLVDHQLELFAEKEMLRIIFRNLLVNSIKYTPAEGIISFSSIMKEGFAYIIVKDTGTGMSKEVLQKVNMQQYFTSAGTLNEKGSGFGLILVRDLISKHRGELLIESEIEKGSTFAVKLPMQNSKIEKLITSVS